MPNSNFPILFEQAAMSLFQKFQQAANPFSFLVDNLPLQYGLCQGFMANRQREVTGQNLLFYDRLKCPVYTLNETENEHLISANFVYGSLSVINEITQKSLNELLVKNLEFREVYNCQNIDNQKVIKPLVIWFSKDTSSHLSLNDVEDRLLAEANTPDLVAVLNKGVLVKLNEYTIQQIYALSQKENAQSFDKMLMNDLAAITHKIKDQQYFKIGASAHYKNCYFFYVLLINLLQHQSLLDEGLSADLVSIW